MNVSEHILKNKIITVARGVDIKNILPLANALIEGGITCMEVALNQKSTDGNKNALDSINLLRENTEGVMKIGVGTALTAAQVREAAAAGAQFVVSPCVVPDVINETKKAGLVSIPGAATPTEIVSGFTLGADFIKLFPISSFGPDYLKAITVPLSHIPIIVMGGVLPENIMQYALSGACGFGISGPLTNAQSIANGDFKAITETAKRYVSALEL